MARNLDPAQTKAVTIQNNAVVSAGAGSGKTSVLSARFAHLVVERHIPVDRILTLTFTKKATVEMYGRIYQTLKAIDPALVAEFHKANIQTLDSYCASIARLGCHRYGISPSFIIDDEALTQTVRDKALPFMLSHRDNKAVRLLSDTRNYEQVAEELFVDPICKHATVSSPIDFADCLLRQKRAVISAWNETSREACSVLQDIRHAVDDFDGKKDGVFMTNLSEALKATQELPECPVLDSTHFEDQCAPCTDFVLSLCPPAKHKLIGGPKGSEEIKSLLKNLRGIHSTLVSLANYLRGFSVTCAAMELLSEFQDMVLNLKRNSSTLTFADVADIARCVLRDHPELRAIEKQKYSAIMIDEFQDNNSMQRDLLFLLAERQERMDKGVPSVEELCPDKLFFVGDEKQSIYRFRGADVSVFRALSRDFADGNLELKTNYRSHPALIAAFNCIFGGSPYPPLQNQADALGKRAVFFTEPAESTDIPSYEAIYRTVDVPDAKQATQFDPRVHVALYDTQQKCKDSEVDCEQAEARWVAQKIKSLVSGQDGKQAIRPGDIAILFRTYKLQPLFERALLAEGIPYTTEVVTGFFSDGPVNDMFAMLRLCAYPEDSLAFAKILRSPFLNLNADEASVLLLQHRPAFEAEASGLCPQSALRYLKTAAWFFCFMHRARLSPLTRTVTELWYQTGYRYETMWNTDVSMYANLYDRMFELARQAEQNAMTLADFVDSMRTYEDESSRLDNMDIPLEKNESVHLLTIFKSKGLEYPVVFLCGADKLSGNEANVTPVYASKEFGITVNTPAQLCLLQDRSNFFYTSVKEEQAAMRSAELRRLTYVALTRAKSELYMTGTFSGTFKEDCVDYLPGGKKNPRTILQVLSPVLEFYIDGQNAKPSAPFTFSAIPPMPRKIEREGRKTKAECIKALKGRYECADAIAKEAVPHSFVIPAHLHEPDDEAIKHMPQDGEVPYQCINRLVHESRNRSGEARFSFANFGTIAHAYLEAAISGNKPVVSNREIAGLENNSAKIAELDKTCRTMQQAFLDSDLGKAAKASLWHKTEYGFKSRIGSKIISGQIDLVFTKADGTAVVVDYKTNQSIQPELYHTQLACYRDAVSAMLGCTPDNVQCWLYYLRFAQAFDITRNCAAVDLETELSRANAADWSISSEE